MSGLSEDVDGNRRTWTARKFKFNFWTEDWCILGELIESVTAWDKIF